MRLMGVLHHVVPGSNGRIALQRSAARGYPWSAARRAETAARTATAGVVKAIGAARVIRVVVGLINVAYQISAGIHGLQIADFAVDRPSGVFEFILVYCRTKRGDLVGPQDL